jgi:hypothetical protein
MNGAVVDTLLNITVFAFVAVLVWLYLRDENEPDD